MNAPDPRGEAAPGVHPAAPTPETLWSVPTIGVDPGQTWTAAVLRVGDGAEHGWTMGPMDKFGVVRRDALNDPDNWQAFARYVGRLTTALDELVDYATGHYGQVRIAVEVPGVPIGWQPGSAKKFQRLPLRDWLIPKQIAAAVIGAFPDARLVVPDHHGRRPASEYPRELRGTRPASWGPGEARGGERDHERAAYDVAGIAMTMPLATRPTADRR